MQVVTNSNTSSTVIQRVASADSEKPNHSSSSPKHKQVLSQSPATGDSSEEVRGLPDCSEKSSRSHRGAGRRSRRVHKQSAAVSIRRMLQSKLLSSFNSTRLAVLLVLCLQNSLFTLLRRYSLGILKEQYSKYELLLVGEVIKILFSAFMIHSALSETNNKTTTSSSSSNEGTSPLISNGTTTTCTTNKNNDSSEPQPQHKTLPQRLVYLAVTSRKMVVLALIYGTMNVLSLIALRNIGAGMFTVFAQAKILSTATFSTLILRRRYTWTQWRALVALSFGVLLFSQPIWDNNATAGDAAHSMENNNNAFLGVVAVLIEVVLSGFASIYFEKVIKLDALQLSIWERNFQLALGSIPVYVGFIIAGGGGGDVGYFGGWSWITAVVSLLGAAGGLLVALSIKYGDSILKTLATTGSIVLAALLDYTFLGGPLTPAMIIAGVNVIIAICNYTFDASPKNTTTTTTTTTAKSENDKDDKLLGSSVITSTTGTTSTASSSRLLSTRDEEEGVALLAAANHKE